MTGSSQWLVGMAGTGVALGLRGHWGGRGGVHQMSHAGLGGLN